MSANDPELRRAVTEEFLSEGLGGKLSRNASMLTHLHRIGMGGILGSNIQLASALACGNIIERILWMGLGQWLGYLQNTAPLSPKEKAFLIENAPVFYENQWPKSFTHMMGLLVDPQTDTGASFFANQIAGSERARGAKELFPVFQAAHVIGELLTEGPITAFFIFLRDGGAQVFGRQTLRPNEVFNFLGEHNNLYDFSALPQQPQQPEAVVAGFIRYTEFLSAMDDLFPGVDKTAYGTEGRTMPAKVNDRELLASEIIEIIKWRVPAAETALAAYMQAHGEFLTLISDQFDRYPELALEWSLPETHAELLRLSKRFFGVKVLSEQYVAISDAGAHGLDSPEKVIADSATTRLTEFLQAQDEAKPKETADWNFEVDHGLTAGEE
jgi:hypothetical protein